MRIIDKLTVIEKALPEGVELNGFYNVEVRRSEVLLRGRYDSNLARTLKGPAALVVSPTSGFIEGAIVVPVEGETEGISVKITLT